MKARPVRAGIRSRPTVRRLLGSMERTAPLGTDLTSRVLARLGALAEIGEHRVRRSLQRAVARANRVTQPVVLAAGAEPPELRVRIEDQAGPRRSPRRARARRMHPDHEERLPTEAEGEAVIGRVGAYRWIPRRAIGVVQELERAPEAILESRLIERARTAEARD